MAGVDNAGLGEVLGEVPQNVLVSILSQIAWHLVQVCNALSSFLLSSHDADHAVSSRRTSSSQTHRSTDTNARPRRPPARDAATDPPAHDAAPHLARGGPVNGRVARDSGIRARTEELKRVDVSKVEYEDWGAESLRQWQGGNWNACRVGGIAKPILVYISLQRRCC